MSTTMLDIIGSILIGGLLLLMGLRLNESAQENSLAFSLSVNLQGNLVAIVTRIESDFRMIAYCRNGEIDPPASAICFADTSDLRFLSDIDNSGFVDTVEYYTGSSPGVRGIVPNPNTPNPRDFYLYRRQAVNDSTTTTPVVTTEKFAVGLTQFRFNYRNCDRDSLLTSPVWGNSIGLIDLQLALEGPDTIKNGYVSDSTLSKVYWRQMRVIAKNLQYR